MYPCNVSHRKFPTEAQFNRFNSSNSYLIPLTYTTSSLIHFTFPFTPSRSLSFSSRFLSPPSRFLLPLHVSFHSLRYPFTISPLHVSFHTFTFPSSPPSCFLSPLHVSFHPFTFPFTHSRFLSPPSRFLSPLEISFHPFTPSRFLSHIHVS